MMLSPTWLPVLLTGPRLSLSGSGWLFALFALLAALIAFFVYRYTLPPVSNVRRTILWVVRGFALILIILLLFEPVLSYLQSRSYPPVIALLIDDSQSMSLEDRENDLTEFLNGEGIRNLKRRVSVRGFAFADSVIEQPVDSLQLLTRRGVGTNPSGAWDQVRRSLAEENLTAIILAGDGSYNIGANPVRTAGMLKVPVFTVGFGDTTFHPDAVIADMLTNEVTYTGSTVPVDLRITGRGLSGRETTVRLFDNRGNRLAEEGIRFSSDAAEITVSMTFKVDQEGEYRIIAVMDSIEGEHLLDNNRRSAIIRVLKSKSQVVLISGPPTADLTILRQTLETDTTLKVDPYIENGDGFLFHRQGAEPSVLESADLVVLINYPSRFTRRDEALRIGEVLENERTSVWVLSGPNLSMTVLSEMLPSLPLKFLRSTPSEETVVVRSGVSHPAIAGRSPLPVEWSDLPPVLGGAGNTEVSAGADVVAKLSRLSIGIDEEEPAVVLWNTARRRGVVYLCWGTYLWKLGLAGGSSSSPHFYDELTSGLVAWLIAPVEERSVKIRPSKKLYAGGERIDFQAQVYGGDLSPRDDAMVRLEVTAGDRTEVVPMYGRGSGRYLGQLIPWMEGEYSYRGTASVNSDTLGSDHGIFAVEAFNIELVDTRARYDVLKQIAEASGGAFAPSDAADSLLARIDYPAERQTRLRDLSLWNRAMVMWIIIGLLSLEWIIRKRSGML